MCHANFETATWVTSAVVAMPPSTRRGGLLAWTIAPSQVRQAYFGMIVLFTRTKAGTTSRASRVSAPIRWSAPEQQGQTVVSGSITSSQRGRWLGSAPMLRSAGRWRRSRPDGQIVEIERELGDVDQRRLLRPCPEEEILQGPHDRPQAVVLRIQRPHHRNQTSRVGGHILRADRHAPKLPDRSPFHHTNQSVHPTRRGLRTGRGETLVQSRPSTSIENCAAVSRTTPPWIGGQVKRPSSSRLVARIRPVPSKARIFTRSARLDRKTKIVPT